MQVPIIKNKIEEVEQRTADMGSMLHGELKLADEAKFVAQAAQENAEQSLSHALTMVEKANQRKKESEQIDKRVNELADKVEDTAKDIEESEKQTEKDSELAKLVLEKANQARTKANETSKRITDMLATLEKILNDLGGFRIFFSSDLCRFRLRVFILKLILILFVVAAKNRESGRIRRWKVPRDGHEAEGGRRGHRAGGHRHENLEHQAVQRGPEGLADQVRQGDTATEQGRGEHPSDPRRHTERLLPKPDLAGALNTVQ